jgi:hypothetical protein
MPPVQLRLLDAGAQTESAGAARRRRPWVWAGVGAVAVTAIISANVIAGRRITRSIPAEQRTAIYARTLDELKQFCGAPPPGLKGHCRELASFVSSLDECRAECEAIVRAQLAPNPTR